MPKEYFGDGIDAEIKSVSGLCVARVVRRVVVDLMPPVGGDRKRRGVGLPRPVVDSIRCQRDAAQVIGGGEPNGYGREVPGSVA